MKEEEIDKLKIGDKVLVEAYVTVFSGYRRTCNGNIALCIKQADGGFTPANVSPESISKVSYSRRLFQKNDIAMFGGKLFYLVEDEVNEKVSLISSENENVFYNDIPAYNVTLVCPSFGRTDI